MAIVPKIDLNRDVDSIEKQKLIFIEDSVTS